MKTIASTGSMSDLVSDVNSNFSEASIKDEAFRVSSGTLSGESVTPNGENTNFFNIMLTQEHTVIQNIANMREGETYIIQTLQDASGKNHIHWGNQSVNTGLNVTTSRAMGNGIIVKVNSGTFDWDNFSSLPQVTNKIKIIGLTNNSLNCGGLVVDSFDESSGEIHITLPWADSMIAETTADVVIISTASNYFFAEEEDNWINTAPFSVTMFKCYTSGGGLVTIEKIGSHTSDQKYKSKARIVQEISDDFVGGDDNGILEWKETNTNGGVGSDSGKVDPSHMGILSQKLSTGKTSVKNNMRLQSDGFVLTNMRSIVEYIHLYEADFFANTGAISADGWNNGGTDINVTTDGFFFRRVGNGDGTARVHCICEADGTETDHDTGIDIDEETWYSFAIQIDPSYSHAHFYINDIEVLKQTDTTNFPTAKLTPFFGTRYNGTALTKNLFQHTDMASIKYRPNADRI